MQEVRLRRRQVDGRQSLEHTHLVRSCLKHYWNTIHGTGWIVQVRPIDGGLLACGPEYHPRQWVDRSSPAYRGRTSRLRPRIPPTQWVVFPDFHTGSSEIL